MNNLYTMGEELLAMIIPAAVGVAWILVLGLVGYVLFHIWINRDRARQAAQTVTLLVRLPKDNETKIEAAEQMFDAIHALKLTTWESLSHHEPNFAIEIVARKEDIAFYLSVQIGRAHV